jgi:ABC-type spermidine/putrescine transport system permease subunit I
MLLCLLIGYPIAYFLAMRVNSFKWQMALFLLCMVPFWTSYLIRAVAWLPMLGRRGLLNSMLLALDIIDKPTRVLLYSEFGYTTALVQIYVVLCVGPIFFSLAKIDTDIIEAAKDMGATAFQIFREIIVPLSLPGVAIGMIFIFVMLMGEFATAVVVYGGKTSTVGTVILNYYAIANYPFAAVNAIMLMLAMMAGVGSKIAASYICFVTTREKSSHTVAAKSDLSIKLLIGSIILTHAILLLGGFINAFKGDGDFGLKLSSCVTLTIELIKNLTRDGGLYLVPALAGSCLLISCTTKVRESCAGWDTRDKWQ